MRERLEQEPIEDVYARLQVIDPEAAARIHPNDEKRIIRALEVWLSTGKTISQHNKETQALPNRYTPFTIGLNFADRADLWARIDKRVDIMMEQGLVDEVEALLASGVPDSCTAMQAIGYKEMVAALREGRPTTEGAEEIKLRSRQYAKRQLTWFRRNNAVKWHLWEKEPDFSAGVETSTNFIREHGLG